MTNEEAAIIIGNIPIKPEVLDDCYSIAEYQWAKGMAIKALEQQRWIPCSERLPDVCMSVLICIKTSNGYFIDVSYRIGFNKWEKYGRDVNVIAWQFLPTPYKEDK